MLLGIDIGTSAVKTVIVSQTGKVLAQNSAPLNLSRPHDLWSEQDAPDWWAATEFSVMSLKPELRAAVQCIGLAGQMHGATLLGQDDRPLRPAILWNDGRSFAECEALSVDDMCSRNTGNIAMPGFTAPKLLWVRKHEPHVFEKIHCVLLPKDYVRLCMTGEKASDLSDSAGTLWLDVASRCWSHAMLDACGLTESQLPSLHEGTQITGMLRPAIADRWGMSTVPVAAGAGDNAAAAAGVGVVSDGDALLSLGTSGVIFAATGEFRANSARAVHSFCHALPGMWHQMSVHLSAASCLDWAARLTGVDGAGAILALAETAGPVSGPELFLPYLSGERTPHNDPHVRGAFLGLDNETDPGRLAAAVLEGVAFAHADGLDALREAGTNLQSLAMVGGGSRSFYWGRIISAVLGVPLTYHEGGDVGPAVGAARLAQIALTGASVVEICARPPMLEAIEPDPFLAEKLAPKLARFRSAYPHIRNIQE